MMKAKKIFSILIITALTISAINAVAIANSPKEDRVCVNETTYNVSIDDNSLIKIALEQYQKKATNISTFSVENNNTMDNSNEFVAVQKLAEKEYSDGTLEKSYVTTGMIVVDKETNEKITPQEYLEASTYETEHHMEHSQYGMYLAQSTYWTVDVTDYPFLVKIRVDSVATRSRNASELYMESSYDNEEPLGWYIHNTISNPGYDQIYWLTGPGRFVNLPDRPFPIWSGARVNNSNGQSYYIQYYINENAEYINGQPA